MRFLRHVLAAGVAVLTLGFAAPAEAEPRELKAMSAFPESFPETQSFLRFIAKVNEAAKDHVQITFVGGPEAIPRAQQGAALKSGVIDLLYSGPTMSAGIFPEANALAASTLTPMQRRELGGTAFADEIYRKRMNAKLLQWIDGGVTTHIYLAEEPKWRGPNCPDLSGLRLRSAELYIEFFKSLGITPVVLGPTEIYTALERGTVQGLGWSTTGVIEGGWNRFLKYWISDPMYWNSTAVTMNLDTWNSLPEEARKIIEDVSIEYEVQSFHAFLEEKAKAEQAFRAAGMQPIDLEGECEREFRDKAFWSVWSGVATDPKLKDLDRDRLLTTFYALDPAATNAQAEARPTR